MRCRTGEREAIDGECERLVRYIAAACVPPASPSAHAGCDVSYPGQLYPHDASSIEVSGTGEEAFLCESG